jgi:hypothetical protein
MKHIFVLRKHTLSLNRCHWDRFTTKKMKISYNFKSVFLIDTPPFMFQSNPYNKNKNFKPWRLNDWYKKYQLGLSHNYSVYCLQSRYSTALYFCFTGLVSVGFGNVAPYTDNEMIFSIILMLAGCKWLAGKDSTKKVFSFIFHCSLATSHPFISRLQPWLQWALETSPQIHQTKKFMQLL